MSTNLSASDYSPANQGQVKWLASEAYAEFMDKLPGDGNTNLLNTISALTLTNGNYMSLNLGQIKALAKPFYDRIQAAVVSTPYVTNALPAGIPGAYPWTTNTTADDADFAGANIGQLKFAFSFDFDRDNNGLPDWWEMQYFGHTGVNATNTTPDGLTYLQAYQLGLNPATAYMGQPNQRLNYGYLGVGWLQQESGIRSESIGTDYEGNVNSDH